MVTQTLSVYFEFGAFVLVQFSLQNLLGHLDFSLEAVWILIDMIWFRSILSVKSSRVGLPLSSKHNAVPKL